MGGGFMNGGDNEKRIREIGEERTHEQLMTFDGDMFFMEKIPYQPSHIELMYGIKDATSPLYYEVMPDSKRVVPFKLYDVRRVDDYPDQIKRALIERSVLAQIISDRSLTGMTAEDERLIRSLDNEGIIPGKKGRFEVYFDVLRDEAYGAAVEPEIVRREDELAARLGKTRATLTATEKEEARYRAGEEEYIRVNKILNVHNTLKTFAELDPTELTAARAYAEGLERMEQESAAFQQYRTLTKNLAQEFIWQSAGSSSSDSKVTKIIAALTTVGTRMNAMPYGNQAAFLSDYVMVADNTGQEASGTIGVGREFIQYKHSQAQLKHGIAELRAAIQRTSSVIDSVTNARKALASPDGDAELIRESAKISLEDVVWLFHEDPYLQRAMRMIRSNTGLQAQISNRTITQRFGELHQGLTIPEEFAFASLFAYAEQLRLEDEDHKEQERISQRTAEIARLTALQPPGVPNIDLDEYLAYEEAERRKKVARGLVPDADLAAERSKNRMKRTTQVAYALIMTKDGTQLARMLESYDAYLTAQKYDAAEGKFVKDLHFSGSQAGSGIEKTMESLLPWALDYRYSRDRASGRAFWSVFIPRRLKRQLPFRAREGVSHKDYYDAMDMEEDAIMNGGSDKWLDFVEENMTIKDLSIKAVAPYDRLGGWRTDQMKPHLKRMAKEAATIYGFAAGTIEHHEYVMDQLMLMGGPRLVQQYIDANTSSIMKLDATGNVEYAHLDVKEVRAYLREMDSVVLSGPALQDVRSKIINGDPITYADVLTLKEGLEAYTAVKKYGPGDEKRYEWASTLLRHISGSMEELTDEARTKYYALYVFDEVQRRMPSQVANLQSRKLTPKGEKLIIDDALNYLMAALPSEITTRVNARAFVQNYMVPLFLQGMNLIETRQWERAQQERDLQLRADALAVRGGGAAAPYNKVIQGSLSGGTISRDNTPLFDAAGFDTDANIQGMLKILHKRFIIAIGEMSPEEHRADIDPGEIGSFKGLRDVDFIAMFKDFVQNGLIASVTRPRTSRSFTGAPVEDLSTRFGKHMALDIGPVRGQLTDICANDKLEVQQAGLTAQGRFVGTISGLKESTDGLREEQAAIVDIVTGGKGAKDVAGALAGPLAKILKSPASDPDMRRDWALRHSMFAIAAIQPPPEFRGSSSGMQARKYIERYGAQVSMFGDALADSSAVIYAPSRVEVLSILKDLARHKDIRIPIDAQTPMKLETTEEIIAAGGWRGRTVKWLNEMGRKHWWGGYAKDFVYRYFGKNLAARPTKFAREEVNISLAKKYFGITFSDVAVPELTSQAFFGILGAFGEAILSGFTGEKGK